MAAAEGGSTTGATIPTTGDSSPYGGGGVGGKFRKRPFRGRQTTPYDRPSTATRPNLISRNNSSWLTKLVVDPAAKLLSYGADRFLASIFKRKQLPRPQTEIKDDVSDGVQGAVSNNQHGEQSTPIGEENLPINESTGNSFSELEQLLKQKTFTRSEIIHLTKLLQSRDNELSRMGGDGKKETSGMYPLESNLLEEDRTNGVRSSDMPTAIVNSMVLEDNITSPTELAKSYMGSRPPKVSHSWRAMRSQTGREDMRVLGNTPLASKLPGLPLTNKTFTGQGAPENYFSTPRSLGRSAIYNMARTPYSRFRSTSNLTGSSAANHVNAASVPSSSASFVEHDDKLKNPTSLKRRNTVLDDEVRSIGPLRRIRQKPNLLVPKTYHAPNGVVTSSDVKQKRHLIGDTRHDVSHAANKYENGSMPSTSYSQISPKSSEVAGRIFQHLEKLSPNEKSSESKLVATREKQHLELKPSMLSARALKSMEDIESSKFMLDFKAAHELPDRSNSALHDTCVSYEKQSPGVKSITNDCTNDNDKFNNVQNSAPVPLKTSGPSLNADSVYVPPLLPKRGFRMSAEEDSLEEDDDVSFNGLTPRPLSEGGFKLEPPSDSKHLHTEQTEGVKPTIQSEVKPSSLSISVQRSEAPSGDGGTSVSQDSEEGTVALKPFIIPPSVSAFGKTKEANNHPPMFSFSSTVAEKPPPFSSESNRHKEESRLENPNSILNASASTGSQPISSESDKMYHGNSLKGGVNGKSENMPSTKSSEPLFPAPVFGTTAASASAASSIPTGTTNSVSSGTDIFGNAANPVTVVSTSTANISEDSKRNVDGGSSSVSPSTVSTSAGKISGSSTFGLLSTNSTASNPQSSTLVSSATESPVPGVETTAGLSGPSVTFASLPSFGMNNSTSSVPSLDSELPNARKAFGLTTTNTFSVTSADAKPVPENGPTSSVFDKFGESSSVASDAIAVTSSSSSPLALFSFGLNSSSSADPIGTSNGASPFPFGFGGNSSASSLMTNTASSFASGSHGSMFSLGASSPASSTSATSNDIVPSWQSSIPMSFGSSSASSSSSPSTGFSFGASSTPSITTTFASSPSTTGFAFSASPTPSPTTTFASPSTGFSFNAPSVTSTNTFAASPSTGFSFGSSSTPSASTNTAPTAFNPSTVAFPFTTAPSVSPLFTQPVTFGGTPVTGFGASSPNQMNTEDSMVEDPSQSTTPPVPVFGQPSAAPGFSFGSTGQQPQAGNPFVFSGAQQNNLQASGSFEFNAAGGSFSLGSSGGDKSGRKIVRINRSKNRRK